MKDKLKQLPDDSAYWIRMRAEIINIMLFTAKRSLLKPQKHDKLLLKQLGQVSKKFQDYSRGIYKLI